MGSGAFSHLSPPIAVCSRPLLFPTCFLPPVTVFCEAAVPPISPLGCTSLGSAFSHPLLLPKARAPAGGGRVLGDSELPLCFSLWGSFRPSLEHIPACPVPRISPDHSHQLILPISPLAKPHLTSASPHILFFSLSFPFYMISAPSPITLSLLSTQALVAYLYPHHSPLHLPFSTQLSLSKTVPNALSLAIVSSSPHLFTAPLRLSGASSFLLEFHSCPSPSLAPQCFSLLRLPPPTPPF